ncbi:MAG: hypothetical protein K8M05_24640 [Deltaproteobacteria bacterium]|nr:hypothetical protein [Kofleriaceae bacterium]
MTGSAAQAPGASPSITFLRGPRGVVLYQDARYGFSIAVPGEPQFMDPGKFVDASWGILDLRALFQVRVMPAPAGANLLDAVTKTARDVAKSDPVALSLDQIGVRAHVRASRTDPTKVRVINVLGGGPAGGGTWMAAILLDYDPAVLDRITRESVEGAMVGSAMFCDPLCYFVPPVFPESAWFGFDPPFALRYPLPPLPPGPPDPALADALLDLVGPLPPVHPLDDARRGQAERLLGNAHRLDPDGAVMRSLATVHDLRGLARTIVIGT